MTKKDFELIAAQFKLNRPEMANLDARIHWREMVVSMKQALNATYPRFKSSKFLRACGMADK